MKTKKIISTAAILLLVFGSSCKKDRSPQVVNSESAAVKFSSSINGQIKTKAVNDTWENGDAVGVFMRSTTGLINAQASNKKYSTTGDGEFTPALADQTIYYPADGSAVDFVAYYPFKVSNPGNVYDVDVTSQNNQSAIDLLYSSNAKDLSKTSNSANLIFTHQLSKIEFTVKNGTGVTDLNGLTAALSGMNTKANFDLVAGTLTGFTQIVDIPAKITAKTNSVLAEAIVIPVADASGNVVTFNLPSGKFKLTLPANTKFEQGKKYIYEIELKKAAATEPVAVALKATITDWNNVPSGSYTVNQDKGDVTPPTGVEEVVLTETFGTGTIGSTRPKIATYTNFDNKTLSFTDAYGNADVRTISSYGDGVNAHIWLPAAKDAAIKISGIKLSGYTKLKIKYDLASNITGSTSTADLNVIKVRVNGTEVNVSSKPITGADQNKFYTLETDKIIPLADNTIEFYGPAPTNTYGTRIDNVILIGIK